MHLEEILNRNRPSLSCEFFPPKTDKGEANLWRCIEELKPMRPAFVSVTYGAGGSTRDRTKRIVIRIKRDTELEPMAHLTCVGATKDDLTQLLDEYRQAGIENILALRGDPPQGMSAFEATQGGFRHATDLIAFIRSMDGFSIACATYPEGHPESKGGVEEDVRYLKMKQDLGAVAAITQYFFDNTAYYRFLDLADRHGVTIPIIPGIMPITNFDQIERFSSMCGARIPHWLHEKMDPIRADLKAVREVGVAIATHQCEDLLQNGAVGLHFYTLNKSAATLSICRNLGLIKRGA